MLKISFAYCNCSCEKNRQSTVINLVHGVQYQSNTWLFFNDWNELCAILNFQIPAQTMQGFSNPCTERLCRDLEIPARFVQGFEIPCTELLCRDLNIRILQASIWKIRMYSNYRVPHAFNLWMFFIFHTAICKWDF